MTIRDYGESKAEYIATLRSIANDWPEGSLQRAALVAAIADVERLDKIERTQMTLGYLRYPNLWRVTMRTAYSQAPTVRIAIDGVWE